tara:strand:+ start:32 stop:607 length:576 start_codon:yes stop_codon:yes gene_type:complete
MKVSKSLYKVKISSTAGLYGAVTEEQFLIERAKYESFPFVELNDFNKRNDDEPSWHSNNPIKSEDLVLSEEQLTLLAIKNIPITVNQEINVELDITAQLVALAEKPIKLIQENNDGDTYNNKCEVHLPGNTLTMYNEMLLMEDACTDELQASLNSGWRIVAACPQPDNRRPDYILGRFNPNLEVTGSAERK